MNLTNRTNMIGIVLQRVPGLFCGDRAISASTSQEVLDVLLFTGKT